MTRETINLKNITWECKTELASSYLASRYDNVQIQKCIAICECSLVQQAAPLLTTKAACKVEPHEESHEPGDGTAYEVLVVHADVSGAVGVSLPEDVRHALELSAHLDKAVQLNAGPRPPHGKATHQRL